ncbi:MAG: Na+/H+ antiporter subunit E [Paracoccaceae bacterium]|jgi:multicomponent K+:H+ antiporter subunit E|uniref:Na+/H+ antiporter subunit E n=1 Tax=unclassified Seohaeicola TaxID=2641111 RepID=UPI00237A27A9|nr:MULTISPECIES: Na+/H+ antiporter subunit E [unclassified Seohaeicola]MDF1707965.1 Na+/H+ antiporter subunit E [Paracoccaceae bacterium]MDD9707656.1 Na+/H+ antiporter subunit E [Seohaeicola sp. 4SK31]MDD9735897.1 Na+/H+ antiporter subunit E [Seohaeicola sp. SP36]MDM7968972.1 Na+/H+ antiporter subunit E [Paracoccaceae bacterium]HSG57111.1 Na+/H+ antiporter subunit E [Paracoccaceae bacterium]
MIARIFPHPLLTLTLVIVWQMLVNYVSLGTLVFGLILGIVIPLLTAPYWPDRPRLKSPMMIVEFILIVLWDIVVANIVVAKTILFTRNASMHPTWITIPLDLRTPEAITVLAGTITMTPGTVSSDVAADGRSLLVHCLNAPDPDAVVADIKQRYERRLKEIFE